MAPASKEIKRCAHCFSRLDCCNLDSAGCQNPGSCRICDSAHTSIRMHAQESCKPRLVTSHHFSDERTKRAAATLPPLAACMAWVRVMQRTRVHATANAGADCFEVELESWLCILYRLLVQRCANTRHYFTNAKLAGAFLF